MTKQGSSGRLPDSAALLLTISTAREHVKIDQVAIRSSRIHITDILRVSFQRRGGRALNGKTFGAAKGI
ncbi:hypothetical protein [Streptomyces sp. NPDC048565]|uniref:hypothetical protein n=1 Tax=Streptomyces sp. NPDC048565 TaxID=3155266 RepID=UPI00341355D6